MWTRLQKRAGVPHHVFHATRHTFATLLLESGADFRFVSDQLGHVSVNQTLSVYSHLIPGAHKHSVEKLNGLVG